MEAHEKAEWKGTKAALGGMYVAKLYIVAPMLLSLLVMMAFGEGDYVLALWAVLYPALFVHGLRKRAASEAGTFQRSLGFWISLWSAVFAILSWTLAILFALYGGWRYFG